MALDNTDANIPLAGGQIPQAFQNSFAGAGQNLNQMLAMQLRMQQLRQVQQSENAMRQAFAPGNVDASGRPTQNAMGMLAQQDPRTFMQLQGQFGQLDERKARTEALQGKVSQEHRKTAYGIGVEALAAYDETLSKTNDPKLAAQKMAEARAQGLDAAVADGSLSKDMAQRFPPPDPAQYRALKSAYEAQNTKPMTQAERIRAGQAEEHIGIDKARLSIEAKKVAQDQDKQLFEGKDAEGKDRTVRMGDGGGWVDAETNERVKGLKGIRKVGTKAEGESGDKYEPSREFAIIDKDGQVVERVAGREPKGKVGDPLRTDGTPIVAPPGGRVELSTKAGGGRQAAAQAMAMLNAGNEASASVANLVDLPVTATSGWFKGATALPAETLAANIKRGLAGYVNERDARALQISWQGIGRSLATLEAAGRATGLVGLSKQAEALQPQKGDTNLNVLRSYAEIRQIVDRSVETMKTSPDVSKDQKVLMDKIRDEVQQSVPWTVKDINALERGDAKTVADFAKKVSAAGASKGGKSEDAPAPPTAKPKTAATNSLEMTKEQADKLPRGAAFMKPGDSTVYYKDW